MLDLVYPMSFIPSSKIKEGLLKCLKHSRRLISGAEELEKQSEHANAVCLAIIAEEEIGKGVFLLRHLKIKKGITRDEWKKYSKERSAHINKLREFREFFKKLPKKRDYKIDVNLLQKIKVGGFYVDWKDDNWYVFDESDLATRVGLLMIAFRLIDKARYAWASLNEEVKSID